MRSMTRISVLFLGLFFIVASSFAVPPAPWEVEELIGNAAPEFQLPDLDGNIVSLSGLGNKVIFINFWATWCPPCKTEMPDLNKLHEKFKERDFVMIGISTDDSKKDIEKFLKDENVDFLILHDKDGKIMKSYKVFSLPMSFILDREHKITEKFLGPRDWASEDFMTKIEELLRTKGN